jgi:geranylgeranyl pyrophosphate synthase
LCCEAAGGQPEWADDLALAWLLNYAAAQLMDSVQDGDEPDAWWVTHGPAYALSAITGLLFSADLTLSNLSLHPETQDHLSETLRDFSQTFLLMGSGQHADLASYTRTLDQFWQQTEAKSGSFFSLACRAGARLSCVSPDIQADYGRYGNHLGILIQITDELEDVRPSQGSGTHGQRPSFGRSLPVIYALEVLSAHEAARLKICLQFSMTDPGEAEEAVGLVNQSGAARFLMVLLEKHKNLALRALEAARPRSPAGEALTDLVHRI